MVHPLPLSELPDDLARALSGFDALVASDEDLSATADEPSAYLSALRACFGERPSLVLTAGDAGVWVDVRRGGRQQVRPSRVVRDRSTVGAGDALAALLAISLGAGQRPIAAAEAAVEGVIRFLTARRSL
jgi:sugar/nucleoside kinase (ribokinase family)